MTLVRCRGQGRESNGEFANPWRIAALMGAEVAEIRRLAACSSSRGESLVIHGLGDRQGDEYPWRRGDGFSAICFRRPIAARICGLFDGRPMRVGNCYRGRSLGHVCQLAGCGDPRVVIGRLFR
jgi:hypothetical protein